MSTFTNETVVEESGYDESPNEAVVVVIVHLDHQIGSKLLTNFYRTIPKFKLNSTIIVQDIEISNELICHTKHNSKSSPPQLLYRGSRDGFNAFDFHCKCDEQGPTLTIIKSSEPYNQIFGGFTTQSWRYSRVGECTSDGSAFIFKIDENNQFRKFNIKQDQQQYAIFIDADYLPIFGGGDIYISSDCNLNISSSNYGYVYELPNNNEYQPGSVKANNYLAGSSPFKVSEIEVFKIIQ